jgi:hypothetical protein
MSCVRWRPLRAVQKNAEPHAADVSEREVAR